MVARLTFALLLLTLAGCQTTGGDFCAVSRPIRPTRAEVATMSDATVADVLAHNRKGAALCRWVP